MVDSVPSWDEYFMQIARTVSIRAKCRRRKVGAVIVDQEKRIVSTGYNGHPARNTPTDCLSGGCPRGLLSNEELAAYTSYDSGPGLCIASHAEANAIFYRSQDVQGSTLYVTDRPCFGCTKMLLGNGVVAAFWFENKDGQQLIRSSHVIDLFEQYVAEGR